MYTNSPQQGAAQEVWLSFVHRKWEIPSWSFFFTDWSHTKTITVYYSKLRKTMAKAFKNDDTLFVSRVTHLMCQNDVQSDSRAHSWAVVCFLPLKHQLIACNAEDS